MLSREDNELLCRVGPGTPMGDLMRQYWVPAALSSELPARDGAPLRVRLLGENLIAFRASSGAVGLIRRAVPTAARASSTAGTRTRACAASITAGSST